ncbi:MAG TPA: CHAD domain-containing protein [Candidatus Sulfotelmatobacter sp.]|nr:CHAD domain-containing protein [Candidatus Sulfotelmatobacter sp.]
MPLDPDQLDKPARKLRKLLKKIPADPSPDQIHAFRTNARKFEAIALANDENGENKELKHLAKLRKRAGKVRDMDVLTAYTAELNADGSEKECSVRLLEHLGTQRHKQADKFRKTAKQYSPKVRAALKRTSKQLEKGLDKPNSRAATDKASDVTSSAVKLVSELSRPVRFNQVTLHAYRKKIKELRNLLRTAKDPSNEEFVEKLGSVKDAIGEWHDWEELLAIATDLLKHPQCRLVRQLKEKAETQFQNALALTERFRKHYLRASRGGRKQPGRPTQPVWSATAALAA